MEVQFFCEIICLICLPYYSENFESIIAVKHNNLGWKDRIALTAVLLKSITQTVCIQEYLFRMSKIRFLGYLDKNIFTLSSFYHHHLP